MASFSNVSHQLVCIPLPSPDPPNAVMRLAHQGELFLVYAVSPLRLAHGRTFQSARVLRPRRSACMVIVQGGRCLGHTCLAVRVYVEQVMEQVNSPLLCAMVEAGRRRSRAEGPHEFFRCLQVVCSGRGCRWLTRWQHRGRCYIHQRRGVVRSTLAWPDSPVSSKLV